ncbi:nuclear RNA export factor 1-like [Penaeus japonicus]|uniref:nuclear RNA export factor 1-like n=1 Tax=Penaeus japonicus TaxID=27405 RepID=UPI001C70F4F9|nr:nuclear RNA export factor 1-like [Penaeus japonicus]
MGKKKRQHRRKDRDDKMFDHQDDAMQEVDLDMAHRLGAKGTSKQKKRMKRKLMRELRLKEQMDKYKGKEGKEEYTGWHTINIQGGSPLEKNFILSSIGSDVEVEFRPLGFFRMENTSGFYLERNEPAATAIAALDKRLQGPDGSRLKINMKKCETPDLVLNTDQLQVLRDVLSKRFNSEACLLDLSSFHYEQRFLDQDILAPLASASIMKHVVRMIRENVPQLKALNLSKNNFKVKHLKGLQGLNIGNSQLAALNLEHNDIRDISVLKQVKMFPLSELNLQFNPLLKNYKDCPLKYIRHVRKEIAHLKIIDGVDIDAYLLENGKVQANGLEQPASQPNANDVGSSSNTVSEGMVRTFLEQYYALIDTPQRSNLVAAYTPDAVLEVKSSVSEINSSVLVGHDEISKALVGFPVTQHQHNTFSFNIQPLSPNITQAIVTGQVLLAGSNTAVAFARKMNIVPFNTGFCCSQDLLELRGL